MKKETLRRVRNMKRLLKRGADIWETDFVGFQPSTITYEVIRR